MNFGSTVEACPVAGWRGVLLPVVVFSRYSPVVMSVMTYSTPDDPLLRVWADVRAKNAALPQNSVRVRLARLEFTCSRCPAPLWHERQTSGRPRNCWPVAAARLSYVSWIGPLP